ncbi:GNAT family N-acetyltransferase [Streptomyces sp. NBC_01477]|uniref:GNAT family N-acetyltransferase n=1 Tax=Streptomyces sp. NBC_01477 TaxID=2976015 RepID=UPI002E30F91E|nr:GNAT family N-acetyltransferase [Streptomyces sp. NBC_01477]
MPEFFIRRLSRWQAEQQRGPFADMFVEAYEGAAGEEFRDRQDFLRRFEDDVQQPAFDMVVAEGPQPMGCAYGFRVHRSGHWWTGIGGGLPSDLEELTASGQVFVIVELMVLPSYRRTGVATRLQEQLLVRTDAARAIALVAPDDAPAGAAYRSWSWEDLGAVGAGSRSSALHVWTRPLD